uniref:Uncharacterized protein n=1 Tax=Glossina palpalis gambiensis TaxID=67801 RepID=A0A1B0C3U2_9MUSC
MLKKLDELEEYPEYYDREIQEIRMEKRMKVLVIYNEKLAGPLITKTITTLLTSYHSSPEFPYKPRSERDSNINIKDEMI